MLEKWKSFLDKGENICVLFMDLSKAFDTVNHDVLLAKLKAGFDLSFWIAVLKIYPLSFRNLLLDE